MKKILIITGILLGFLIINIFSVKEFYNNFEGNRHYQNKNLSGAINNFRKANNYIGLYNIGNSNYRLGELEKNNSKKVLLWEKSLKNYTDSMKNSYTKNAEENYNFVKNKLEELKKKIKEDNNKQNENKQNENKQNENKQNENKQNENKQNENKQDENKSGEENKDGENKDGKTDSPQQKSSKEREIEKKQKGDKLTKQQEQALKQYEKQLKNQQKEDSYDFNKVYKEQKNDPFDNLNSFFGNDPFFNNSLLDSGNEKKDW